MSSLTEIDRHVAWFYVTAIRSATDGPSHRSAERDARLLRRVLRTSEAFTTAMNRLGEVKPHPDDILDLAVILGRALNYWNRARAKWDADSRYAALAAAATELADAADALEEAVAAAPWFGNDSFPNATLDGGLPRKVQ